MFVKDQTYLDWQKSIKDSWWVRWFWYGLGVYIVVLMFATFVDLYWKNPKALVIALSVLVFARIIFCEIFYFFYKKQRPYQRLGFKQLDVKFLLSPANGKPDAFPSGHSVGLMAISVVFYWFLPYLGPAWIIGTFINGMARVILGYHDPEDVLIGWVIGAACGFLALYLGGII
jgi:membrane-associated phospholipid phosphatase